MNSEKREKENAYIAIIQSLEKALKDCQEFDDLKIFPGEEIENLMKRTGDQMISNNWTVKKD